MKKLDFRFLIALTIVAALSLLSACSDEGSVSEQKGSVNLISLLHAAKIRAETGVLNLSSKLSSFYLASGWSAPYEIEDSGVATVAAVAQECTIRFRVINPAHRWLSFAVKKRGKYGGPKRQRLNIIVAGNNLASIIIRLKTQNELVHLPRDLQKRGINEIIFRFSEFRVHRKYLKNFRRHKKKPYPGTAAYFSDIKILAGGSGDPDSAHAMDEREAVQLIADNRYLSQVANSTFSYVVEDTEGRTISLAGVLEADEQSSTDVTLLIRARTDSDLEWKELWRRNFSVPPGKIHKEFKADFALDKVGESPAEISFGLFSSRPLAGTKAIWKELVLYKSGGGKDGLVARTSRQKPDLASSVGKIKHVIVIVVDAARPDYFGCYGDSRGMTPNIDDFAKSAILFRNAIASAPYTISSISTLFSGLSPERHGVTDITNVYPSEFQNMARAFKEKGFYTLALAGTQFITSKFGITRDCDQVVNLRSRENVINDFSEMEFEPIEEAVSEAAASQKPVFIYAHFLPPHSPYRPPEPFNQRFISNPEFERWRFRHDFWRIESLFAHKFIASDHPDMIKLRKAYMNNFYYADHVTNRLLGLIKNAGLYDDSLIIITSDHSESFGEHGAPGHNRTVYEDMIKVPLIIRLPDGRSGEIDQLVGLIDIFPTLNEIAALGLDAELFEGRSLAALLAGERLDPGDYYYLRATNGSIFSLRGERFKYIHNVYRDELYDLLNDPGEKINIVDKRPVLAATLRQRALLYRALKSSRRLGVGEVELTPEDERELRNLGYLQ